MHAATAAGSDNSGHTASGGAAMVISSRIEIIGRGYRYPPEFVDSTRSGGYGQPHQVGRIGFVLDGAHCRDQSGGVDKRCAVGGELTHLGVELGIAHRSTRCAAAVDTPFDKLSPSALPDQLKGNVPRNRANPVDRRVVIVVQTLPLGATE